MHNIYPCHEICNIVAITDGMKKGERKKKKWNIKNAIIRLFLGHNVLKKKKKLGIND